MTLRCYERASRRATNHCDLQHVFLRRLPNLPQLRSLNIPNILNHIFETLQPKELAMQIADIITLRPEIQLCYVGIDTKCFEILESTNDKTYGSTSGPGGNEGGTNGTSANLNGATDAGAQPGINDDTAELDTSEDDGEDDGEDDDDEDGEITDDDEDGGGDGDTPTNPTDPDETQSETSGADDSDDDSFVEDPASKTRLRLREILFYDDKVAIFKARHGKL